MTKLSELIGENGYLAVPKLERRKVKLLWVTDFYDAPLSGMAFYAGRSHLYQMYNKEEWLYGGDEVKPIYLLIELSKEQLQEEEYWHDRFVREVWNGWDYDEDEVALWHRPEKVKRGTSNAEDFSAVYQTRNKQDFSENMVIGWFERR
jgi:hypothetical protein